MKKLLRYFCLLISSFLLAVPFPSPVFAHLVGQPPYLQINGKYTNLYPVPVSSLDNFPLPQDMAPDTYLVNQKLIFTMIINRLPAPPDVVKKTTFTWDFGDGGKGVGLTQSHIYKKPGSYLQIIYADDGTTPTPQLLSSALINVLPNPKYRLPRAIIRVNNQQSRDPLNDILKFPLNSRISFDASLSQAPSSKIVSYFWDFGDQKTSSKITDTHTYTHGENQVFPLLRITDANGFISDNYVELENGQPALSLQAQNQNATPKSAHFQIPPPVLDILLFLVIGAGVIGTFLILGKGKKVE